MSNTKIIFTAYTLNLNTCVTIKAKNKWPLFGVVALCKRMQTSPHISLMLRILCPFPQALLALALTPHIPLNPQFHTCDAFN
jgi:hypothetical protein